MSELTMKEIEDELTRNPDLLELIQEAIKAEKTDPAAVKYATDLLQGTDDLPKKFYTVPEAAELLGVHPNTIYHMEQRREIEYYKPGKKIKIPASEIERLKHERAAK